MSDFEVKNIKQSPQEEAINAYNFFCAELQDGIDYPLSLEVARQYMVAIGASDVFTRAPKLSEFCKCFHEARRTV